jgi:hypothetical protein
MVAVRGPARARGPARGTETELLSAVREALNYQAGVRLRRNNSGRLKDVRGRWVQFGQGVGSPDLMGAVTMHVTLAMGFPFAGEVARCFHLECKLPGEKLTEDQLAWHKEARSRGEFVAVVHSVEEALLAVARCRAGAVE